MNSISQHSLNSDGALSAQGDQVLPRLHQFLGDAIVTGYPQVGIAARVIGISVRSLQRDLARKGTSYSRVVAGVRFQMACVRLLETREKLIDIALALGYSDAASFSRAFGRWARVSPGHFRNQGRRADQIQVRTSPPAGYATPEFTGGQ